MISFIKTILFIVTVFSILVVRNISSPLEFKNLAFQEAQVAMFNWKINYETTVRYIKSHEGFNYGRPYNCPAGYYTIGYGHVVKEGEHFGDRITEQQAEELLRKDFNKAIKMVEKNTNLKGNKKLAIAHFIFAKGIGSFLRSNMKKKIDAGEPIDEEIMKWTSYTSADGRKITSKVSAKHRQWELELYNKL